MKITSVNYSLSPNTSHEFGEFDAMYNYIVSVARATTGFSYVAICCAENMLTTLVSNENITATINNRHITVTNNTSNSVYVDIVKLGGAH